MSSETVLFDLRDADGRIEHYVARVEPLPEVYPVFPEYNLDLQKRCMELVRANTDVPAPEVPYAEADPSWLGSPFIVMKRVEGVPPLDVPPYVFGGWVMDATPEERARMQHNAVDVLVRLHAITPEQHDLGFLMRPEHGDTALDQLLGYQRWYYDWAREGATYPLIERTFEWLEANRPTDVRTVFLWGDSRIGNMLWQDFAPVAVLDWEMATVGPPEVDVAWMIFLHSFFQDLAARFEMPGLPDFMDRAEIIATYEELSGHAAARRRVVRGVRRAPLRDRVDPHEHPRHRVRIDGTTRRSRRPRDVPGPAGADARRHLLGLTAEPSWTPSRPSSRSSIPTGSRTSSFAGRPRSRHAPRCT